MSKDLIVKSYDFVEASYKLTPSEAKLIAILTSQIEKDDKDFKMHRFNSRDLLESIGLGIENYDALKDITKNLMSRILLIRETNRYIQVAFLSAVIYYDHEGFVDLRFDPVLKPYLLELKEKFIKYKIEQILALHSFYSIRFYELVIKWEQIGSFKMTIEELRKLFKIQDKEYKLYGDLKRKVILVAQKELKEKADLYFEIYEIKESRKVVALDFQIKRKKQIKSPSKKEAKPIQKETLNESDGDKHKKVNIALGEGTLIRQLQDEQLKAYDNKTDKIINQSDFQELIKAFIKHLKSTENKEIVIELYKRQGINNILVKTELRRYVSRKYLKTEDYDLVAYAKLKGHKLEEYEPGKYRLISR